VTADDDSLITPHDSPRPTRIPPSAALRLDAAAVAVACLIALEAIAGPSLPLWKTNIRLPSIPVLLGLLAVVALIRHLVFRGSTVWDSIAVWRERLDRRPDVAAAFRAFMATRPAVFLVAYFAVVTFGLAPTASRILSNDPLANLPVRFDAGWYGSIALVGYQWDGRFSKQANTAFFPALPVLMQPVGDLIGARGPGVTREGQLLHYLWAGVFISLASFFVGLIYLARLSRLIVGPDAAAAAPMLLAAYPFAVFFNAPYTEGLFLFAAVGTFYHFHREQWVAASLLGLLVGLSRPNGCLVSVPLAILGAQAIYSRWSEPGSPPLSALARPAAVRLLVAAMPGFAMLGFTAYLRQETGVWFAWARMQEAWGRTLGTRPMAQGWEWLTTEGLMPVTRGVPFDTLNTVAVLFVLALSWSVLKRVGFAYLMFVALNLLPPVFTGGALSMGRITSTLFPVFIALAARLPRQAVPLWVTGFAVVQGLVATLFFTWRELF
jgi:hypothetical protein